MEGNQGADALDGDPPANGGLLGELSPRREFGQRIIEATAQEVDEPSLEVIPEFVCHPQRLGPRRPRSTVAYASSRRSKETSTGPRVR